MSGKGRSQRVLITRSANTMVYGNNEAIGNAPAGQPSAAIDTRLEFTDLLTPNTTFLLMSLTLEYHVAAIPAGLVLKLELYNALPTAVADNAAWDFVAGDRGKHIGTIVLDAFTDEVATLKVDMDKINKLIKAGASRSLFAILTTTAAGGFTPAGNSEVLALTLSGAPI